MKVVCSKEKEVDNGVKTFEISDDALERAINEAYGTSFSGELVKKHHAGVPTMGLASGVIAFIAKKLVGAMLGQVNPYKVGRVYKIRNWKYAGWRYQ